MTTGGSADVDSSGTAFLSIPGGSVRLCAHAGACLGFTVRIICYSFHRHTQALLFYWLHVLVLLHVERWGASQLRLVRVSLLSAAQLLFTVPTQQPPLRLSLFL